MKIHFLFYLASFFLLSTLLLKAQSVNIPDINFRTFLETKYPSSMQSGELYYMNDEIKNEILVDVSYLHIQNMEGIQYFSNLQALYCFNNNITQMPPLPSSLYALDCDNNQLTSLPALPSGLFYLSCENNQLSEINSLPSNLHTFNCSHNPLVSGITASLPSLLNHFNCDSTGISTLPALPSKLRYFYANHNALHNLPLLPDSLHLIDCSNNNISSIGTVLPDSLVELICANNQISCLPHLPDVLETLIATGNTINCLPNIPSAPGFTSDIGTVLCDPLSTNDCRTLLTAIQQATENESISLFPNPSDGICYLQCDTQDNGQIQISTPEGKCIYSQALTDPSKAQQLNLQDIPKGLYIVQVVAGQKVMTRKLVLY